MLDALEQAKAAGRRYAMAHCTKHADATSSLMVFVDGWAKCLAGCFQQRQRPLTDFYPEVGGVVATSTRTHEEQQALFEDRETRVKSLTAVLSWLLDREQVLRDAIGSTHIGGETAWWLTSRGLDPSAVYRWVVDGTDASARALHARFDDHVLVKAGLLSEESGKLCFGPGRRALLIYRDSAGAPTWMQAAATVSRDRLVGPKYRNPSGTPPAVFGADTVANKAVVVVCEGAVDALSVLQHGVGAAGLPSVPVDQVGAVAFPGVGNVSTQAVQAVVELAPKAEYLVATDPDPAGDRAAVRIGAILARKGVSYRRWRPAGGDINDTLRNNAA